MWEVQKWQNGVRDLGIDLENDVEVRRSRNFNWPYLGPTQNQNVYVLRSASTRLYGVRAGKLTLAV